MPMPALLNQFNNGLVPFIVEDIKITSGRPACNTVVNVTVKTPQGKDIQLELSKCALQLNDLLQGFTGISLPQLKYSDLLFSKEYCNGIYIFLDPNETVEKGRKYAYVGSCASRSIVDRIGSHHALRGRDFMNSVVRYIAVKKTATTLGPDDLDSSMIASDQVLNAFSQLFLLYIPVKNNLPDIKRSGAANTSFKVAFDSYRHNLVLFEHCLTRLLTPSLQ